MKPGQLDTASKTELGHTMFYWLINLKMNVDYKTTLIHGQPILDCMVPYLIQGACGEHGAQDLTKNNAVLYHKKISPRFARQFVTKETPPVHFGIYLNSGSEFVIVEGAGRYRILFREHKNYFGEHHESNSGSLEKRVKFQREPGAGDPPSQSLTAQQTMQAATLVTQQLLKDVF